MNRLSNPFTRTCIAAAISVGGFVSLTACGSSGGANAPKAASVADFCSMMKNIDMTDPKAFVADLKKTGTPADIPGDAREGFEVMIDNADKDSISADQQDQVKAFLSYFTTTCSPS